MTRPKTLILIIFIALLLALSYLASSAYSNKSTSSRPTNPTGSSAPVSDTTEQQRIDAWIASNHLNTYGDRRDLNYPGGTPLFNESTGQTKNRYDYILSRHPDRPWNK